MISTLSIQQNLEQNVEKQLLQKTSYPRCRNNENEGSNRLGQKLQDILKFPFRLHCINTLTSHIQFLFIIATSLQIAIKAWKN
jgi:hypothetical protein